MIKKINEMILNDALLYSQISVQPTHHQRGILRQLTGIGAETHSQTLGRERSPLGPSPEYQLNLASDTQWERGNPKGRGRRNCDVLISSPSCVISLTENTQEPPTRRPFSELSVASSLLCFLLVNHTNKDSQECIHPPFRSTPLSQVWGKKTHLENCLPEMLATTKSMYRLL